MKNISHIILSLFILTLLLGNLSGCKSSPEEKETKIEEDTKKAITTKNETKEIKRQEATRLPEEHLKSTISNNILYATGTGKNKNMQLALEKAADWAKQKLTGIIEVKVFATTKHFLKEAGVRDTVELLEFSEQLSRKLASNVMSNSKIKEREVKAIDNNFVAYTTIELSLASISKAIDEIIIYYEIEYSTLNANNPFDKLAEELKKLKVSDYISE